MRYNKRNNILALLLLLLAISLFVPMSQVSAQGGKLTVTWIIPSNWTAWDCVKTPSECDTADNNWTLSSGAKSSQYPVARFQPTIETQLGTSLDGIWIFADSAPLGSLSDFRAGFRSLEECDLYATMLTTKFQGYPAHMLRYDFKMEQNTKAENWCRKSRLVYRIDLGTTRVLIEAWDWTGSAGYIEKGVWSIHPAQYIKEIETILASLRFVGSSPSSPAQPVPAATACTPTVRGLSPQKPGDVISPGATFRDATGKEVGNVQERWYFNGKETTSIVWDGKKVTVQLQWSCPNNFGDYRTYEIPAYQAAPPAQPPAPPSGKSPSSSSSTTPADIVIGIGVIIVIGVGGLIGIGGAVVVGGAVIKSITRGAPPALPKPSSPSPKPQASVVPPPQPSPPAAPPIQRPGQSPAGPPGKPVTTLSPEAKKKAMDDLRKKQDEDYKESDKAKQKGKWWGGLEDGADWIKNKADVGVDILSTITGPAGKMIKGIYETTNILVDHADGAIQDGKYKDHVIGAVSDLASKKATDMLKDKVGGGADWIKGKAADKLGKVIPSTVKNKISQGIGSVSNKIFGTGNTSYGSGPDLGRASITTTIKSALGAGDSDLGGHVRKKIWDGAKDWTDDKAKDCIRDQFIKTTTGGKIEGGEDYQKKLSGIIQQTTTNGLDKIFKPTPKPGVEKFR